MDVKESKAYLMNIKKLKAKDIEDIIDKDSLLSKEPENTVELLYKQKELLRRQHEIDLATADERRAPVIEIGDSVSSHDIYRHIISNNINIENPIKKEAIKEYNLDASNNIDVYEYEDLDVTPIENVIDDDGSISRRIKEIEDAKQVSVIPYELLDLPNNLRSLKSHTIINYNGVRLVSGIDRIVNMNSINEFENKVLRNLKEHNGSAIKLNLEVNLKFGGGIFRSLMFNEYELRYLVSRFKQYKVTIVKEQKPNGDEVLMFCIKNSINRESIGRRII